MANLVTVTKESRLILKIGGIFCGVVLVLYIVIQGGKLMRDIFFPKPPPPPREELGRLPHVKFPAQNPSGGLGIQYTVNTVDGQLPVLPDRINVYQLVSQEPNLLALETAKNTLDTLNFVENQAKLTSTLYRWTQSRTGIAIEYDIVSKNFMISSNYLTNPNLASSTLLPDEEHIIGDAKGYLNDIGANFDNIELEKTKVEYLEIKNGILMPAENLGSARFARITLVQKNIDDTEIIYADPNNSILSFVVSYPDGRFQILDGSYYNYIINLEKKSDYPIKTAEEALEDMKNGKAFIVNPQNLTNVDITDVKLFYILNRDSTEFLLPVIVFTGINFTGYVEAIPDTSLLN